MIEPRNNKPQSRVSFPCPISWSTIKSETNLTNKVNSDPTTLAYLPITVEGSRANALWDTSSIVTLIQQDFYNSLPVQFPLHQIKQKLLSTTNHKLPVIGRTCLKMEIGTCTFDHMCLVVSHMEDMVLIG